MQRPQGVKGFQDHQVQRSLQHLGFLAAHDRSFGHTKEATMDSFAMSIGMPAGSAGVITAATWAPVMNASWGSVTRPLRLPEGICACATQTDIANRKIRATPPFGVRSTPFLLLKGGANLTKASDTVFSLPVGSKAIVMVEARWETAA